MKPNTATPDPARTPDPTATDPTATDPQAVVAELYRLFADGLIDRTFDLMHADVVLHEPGDPALLPWAGEFQGHDGLRRFYEALSGALSSIEIDPDSLRLFSIDAQRVLALGTERGTAASTGRSYETRSAWIWTVDEGRIKCLTAYHDTAAMTAAFA